MNPELAGKVALVIGGTSGIGLAAAEELERQGATVVAAGLAPEVAAIQADWLARGIQATVEDVDITDETNVERLVGSVVGRHNRLDILVHAAGIQRYGSAADATSATWNEVFDVNVRGAFFAVKHALPALRKTAGSIVVVSSVQAFITQSGVAAYTASKGALNAFVRSVAVDEAAHGVRANAVCPGSVDTPMLRASARSFSDGTEAGEERLIAQWGISHPLGRVARASEVADVIAFLAGPRSSFVTGVALPVDGGLLASVSVVLPDA